MPPSRRRSPRLTGLIALTAAGTFAGTIASACAAGQRVAPDAITGRRWSLVELGGAPVAASPEPSAPSFTLSADSTLTGQGGCNGFRGRWSLTGDRLTTGGIAITRRACTDAARQERETQFVRLLEAGPRVTLANDTLRLASDGSSARLVVAP